MHICIPCYTYAYVAEKIKKVLKTSCIMLFNMV
nr:MAG TPA: hypothetical protein [Caudoviricetes sp.]